MSWKFKVSKYKNAAPNFPKREDAISELPVGRLMNSCGNHIAASCTYMAFNVDTSGGHNIGILPLTTKGRVGQSLTTLKAHADYVTDFAFSPFSDRLIATCSADATVKLWQLPDLECLSEQIDTLSPRETLPSQERKVENVLWNPVADGILAVSVGNSLKVFDVEAGTEKCDISSHGDQLFGISWHGNGTLLSTVAKDKMIRVIDPRAGSVIQECKGHAGNREMRTVWVGDSDFFISTGNGQSHSREVMIWDSRNLQSPLKKQDLDNNTGTLMPLLDEDTSMLFLVGKADTSWIYAELSQTDPYITVNNVERMDRGEQIKGACLVPKLAMDVMTGEVNRLLLLINNGVISTPIIVPRRQYTDFHADIFPDTKCRETTLTASAWCKGDNSTLSTVSLDPTKKNNKAGSKGDTVTDVKQTASQKSSPSSAAAAKPSAIKTTTIGIRTPEPAPQPVVREPSKAAKTFSAMHQSKCKYLKGVTGHPSNHIVNLRRLCRTLPGQSNLICANSKRCAIPIEGAGGLVAVIELDKPGRLPDTGIPVVQTGDKVNDFVFDPFDDTRLLVGCENAKVYIFKIPECGLTDTLTEYESYLSGHNEKIYFVRFHPLAKDVVVTAAYDMCLKIWDLTDNKEKINITTHTDEIFCAEWSPNGKLLATVCKDGKVRIFDPRTSTQPIKEGTGPTGSRGARAVWALDMKYLVISGFGSTSLRTVSVYNVADLEQLYVSQLDVSPSILIPEYDEGTSTLFLTGRGDSSIVTFEVSEEYPHLFPLAPIKPDGLHQGIVMMPKTKCNVKNIEIANLWRLTQTSIEPISVTVPRVRTEYFQDDLFPDILLTGTPTMTSSEWFKGEDRQPAKVSLRPKDMTPLSEAPVEAPKARKYDSYNPDTFKTDEEKKEELISAMTNKLDIKEEPLPQDEAEGVDPDEWDDY